jgi:hypothetical protein
MRRVGQTQNWTRAADIHSQMRLYMTDDRLRLGQKYWDQSGASNVCVASLGQGVENVRMNFFEGKCTQENRYSERWNVYTAERYSKVGLRAGKYAREGDMETRRHVGMEVCVE